jgi:hypothetical protein
MRVITAVTVALALVMGTLVSVAQLPPTFHQVLPTQDSRSSAKNGGGGQTAKTAGHCRTNPASCLKQIQSSGKGTCYSCPKPGSGGGATGGNPSGPPGDPLLYSEESIPNVLANFNYNPTSGPGAYVGSNADINNPNQCHNTAFASELASANGAVVASPWWQYVSGPTVSATTFYAGDGNPGNSIGWIGSQAFQWNALEADAAGTTTGIALAPTALTNSGSTGFFDLSMLVNFNFCQPTAGFTNVLPWANGYTIAQINANVQVGFPYTPITDGLIDHQGLTFGYFVIYLQNVNDPTQQILLGLRFFQSVALSGADLSNVGYVAQFGSGDGIWTIGPVGLPGQPNYSPDTPIFYGAIGYSQRISNCGDAPFKFINVATGTGDNGQYSYCAQITATQLNSIIAFVNASSNITRHNYDTTAANWQVLLINQNYEAWNHCNPGGGFSACDTRLGLNTNGFQFSIQ